MSEKTAPAKTLHARVTRLEELLGCGPDVLGNPGTGVLGKLATMDTKLDDVLEAVTKRRALTAFLAKAAAIPLVGAVVVAAFHYLSGFHR